MFNLTLQQFQYNVVFNTYVHQTFSDKTVIVLIDILIIYRYFYLFILGNMYSIIVFHFIDRQLSEDIFAMTIQFLYTYIILLLNIYQCVINIAKNAQARLLWS